MTPVPQEHAGEMEELRPDSIVISGVSTLIPGCESFLEFAEKLYKKERLVIHDPSHWHNLNHPELSPYIGKLPEDLSIFDAQFFKVHSNVAGSVDVLAKKLMEQSFRAVFDSGICPSQLNGKSVAVYTGIGTSENDKTVFFSNARHGLLGSNRTMFANRISYFLNITGPSVSVDSDCCGSFTALELAQQAIRSGVCESAIVASARLTRHPHSAIVYHRNVPAAPDGKMRSYDEEANGQFLSEAVSVVYLQKYKDAKRVYAHLHHVKCSFTKDAVFGEEFKLHRKVDALARFFRDFYDEARIPPSLVEYVDGFGAAVPDFDRNELEALAQVFCKDRARPLTVGSVASNVGHTDAVSGLCGIVKILIAYQKGEIAGNLDCEHPRRDISAIQQGTMQIASEHKPFRRTYSAVNTFSVGGTNGHVLLQGHYKPKKVYGEKIDLPYLLLASGRTESAVSKILKDVGSRPIDPEELGLLHNIFKSRISQHLSRGYGLFASESTETKVLRESKARYDEVVRPLWFVYSGMGSQFAEMGADLMRIPVFANAIYRCHKVLEPKGIDLISIITNPDESVYDYILNSFIGIAAIQIGLTDVLKHVGLVPDNIIGHSVGELGCAYADHCITAEEMILMSYYRGLVSVETAFIKGAMAAVGIGYKKILGMCPPDIDVACRNGPNSCTISGPADSVASFVQTLKAKGIFAKAVNTSNIAYHSRYIAKAGPKLLQLLKSVVKTPKLRSKRWISTSVPQNKWNEHDAMYSGAEYYTNNLLNPVLFEDMLRFIPSNAVLVEIAPYGLLQAILKRSLSPDCQHIPLTRREDNNAINLLEALGKLYMAGYDVDPSALYPTVEFPVSTGTRPLSHLIELVHEVKWPVCVYNPPDRKHNAVYRQVITVYDDDYSYLAGHSIEGAKVYPFAAALISVWDTLAMTVNLRRGEVSVAFQDVILYFQPKLKEDQPLHVTVTIQRGCGRFEVTCDEGVIADGIITAIAVPFTVSDTLIEHTPGPHELSREDVYKLFYERGHEYSGQFQSICNIDSSLTHGQIRWSDNWVTFLDAMLQMLALRSSHDGVTQLDCIKRIAIDFKKHLLQTVMFKVEVLDATFDELRRTIKCCGVVIEAARFKNKAPSLMHSVSMKTLKFVPFIQEENCDVITTLYVYAQIVAENLNKKKITAYCINKGNCGLDKIKELLQTPPLIELDIIYLSIQELFGPHKVATKPDLVYTDDLWNKVTFETLFHTLPRNTFMLSQGLDTKGLYPSSLYRILCSAGSGKNRIELARWRPTQSVATTTVLTVKSPSDLKNLQTVRNNLTKNQKLLILAPHSAPKELKELVKDWKDDINNISVAMMPDKYEDHDLKPLSNFDFVFNILQDGVWGGEYYVPTSSKRVEIENVALNIMKPGDFDSIKWEQIPEDSNKGVPVTVHFAGLNSTDVYRADRPDTSQGFGMDFSGLTENGDRVMGLVKCGAARNKLTADPRLLWPVPEQWSLEDAATVPLAYAHAFYCLAIRGKLCAGMTVLIHGGAGALGQAAISIALAYGCQVFTTVSDVRKKHFLRKLFTELKEENIGNSRDETFGDMIITRTKNEGCDIIISCVRGALKNTTLKCVASGGIAIDTVQLIDPENCNYGLFNMFRNRSFMLVDFSSIFTDENSGDILKLHLLISEGIALGHVRPLSRVTYSPTDAPRALRLLAGSRHRGRVLMNLQGLQMEPRIICSPVLCQLIISSREDFAIQLAGRLVARGAKKIHLNCTKPTSYLKCKKISWQNLGVQVHTTSYKLNTRKEIESLLKEANLLASVEGIYVMNAKGSEYLRPDTSLMVNLDLESRRLCRNLKNFTIITDDETQRDVIENRTQGGLQALLLILQDIKQFGALQDSEHTRATEGPGRWRLALDVIERALQSGDSMIYANIMPKTREVLMEEVYKIPGLTISKATSEETTLQEIGVDSGRAQELCCLLKVKFGITVPEKDLPAMTIAELKNLQKHVNIKADEEGFGAFISMVADEELMSTTDIIAMPTLIQPNGIRPEELNRDEHYLIVVPGLEAHYARFGLLCERLKMRAVVLQPGIDRLEHNVEELAQRMVNIIRKKLSVKDHYYLVGYEFGAIIILEMAAILEKMGLTSTIYLLGGTPKDIQSSLESQLASINGGIWENGLATHISSLIKGSKCHIDGLEKAKTWTEKVEACIKTLRPIVSFSTDYIKKQIHAAYNRIKMLRKWNLKMNPLKSKVIILRAVLPTELSKDELELLSSDVNIFNLSTRLSRAARDLLCSAIVNKYLNPDILEAFKTSNQCETSLITEEVLKLKVEEKL